MKANSVVKTSIVVMSFVIVGKVAAFVRDALVASNFGATYASDIYLFAIGLVYLLTSLSYGLTTTLIPLHTDNLEKDNKEEGSKFVYNVLNTYTLFTLIVTVLCIIFAKYIVMVFTPGFAERADVLAQAVTVTRIILISLFFLSAQSVITGVLQAHNKFYTPAAMAAASNVVYIIYLVFFAKRFGLVGFAWVTVLGFFIQLAINMPTYLRLGYRYRFYISLRDKKLMRMFLLMIPIVISTAVTPLNLFVNRFYASMIGEGAVSALDYANKLNTLVDEIFAVSVSMVIYPVLASLISKDDKEQYGKTLMKSINIVLMVMVPAAVASSVLRYPIINVIFRRGKFDSTAVLNTANALLFYTPAMIAIGTRGILNRAYYSLQDTRTPMINSLYGIALNAVLSLLLFRHLGVAGLTISASISSIIVTLIMIKQLKSRVEHLNLSIVLQNFKKIVLSSLIMGVVLYGIDLAVSTFGGSSNMMSLLTIIISLVVGLLTYFSFIKLFKMDELDFFVAMLKKKLKKQ